MDLFLAGYPSVIIWQLQMPVKLKIGIGLLMALGVLMGVCSIGKMVELPVVSKASDPTSKLFVVCNLCVSFTKLFKVTSTA